jgi:hypothetical protein
MIYDLAVRRELIGLGRDISARAGKVEVDSEPRDQISEAEQRLQGTTSVKTGLLSLFHGCPFSFSFAATRWRIPVADVIISLRR